MRTEQTSPSTRRNAIMDEKLVCDGVNDKRTIFTYVIPWITGLVISDIFTKWHGSRSTLNDLFDIYSQSNL
jgi:hypothetical protein